MTDLTIQQLKAINMLASGAKSIKVAEELGVTEQTLCNWKNNPEFAKYLKDLKWQMVQANVDEMRVLAKVAVNTLEDVMRNSKSDSARLKAASMVLYHAGLTDFNSGHLLYGID